MKREAEKENRDLIHRKRSPFPGRGEGSCDGCEWLEIEPPVNRYDNWRACCCDPDKPMHGARRVVSTAPAGSERGPVGIQTPAWCVRNPPGAARQPPLGKGAKEEVYKKPPRC